MVNKKLPTSFRFTKKTEQILKDGIKKYKKIIKTAYEKGLNESDTNNILTDFLSEMFGYDKFFEITSEYRIKGQYCDFAIKVDDKVKFLIESKSIKVELNNNHIFQAQSYAGNEGLEWVVLTNLRERRIYHLSFGKKVEADMFLNIDVLEEKQTKKITDTLRFLHRESFAKKYINKIWEQKKIASEENIRDLLISVPIIRKLQSEVKRLSGLKIPENQIEEVVQDILDKSK